jgi:hypothetical protein
VIVKSIHPFCEALLISTNRNNHTHAFHCLSSAGLYFVVAIVDVVVAVCAVRTNFGVAPLMEAIGRRNRGPNNMARAITKMAMNMLV